jgi:hypothetical protein
MSRLRLCLVSVAVFALTLTGDVGASAEPIAYVDPAVGSMYVEFTFMVDGAKLGDIYEIVFYDAENSRYTYQINGQDQVFIAGEDGQVGFSIVPVRDLKDPVPGRWRAVFQEQLTGANVTLEFDVTT